ncbi:MAG: SHOCT domain-containing protein [Ruminococcus sp.]|nr:SHOCT domain-containing protein [Ruminococcus sp.]
MTSGEFYNFMGHLFRWMLIIGLIDGLFFGFLGHRILKNKGYGKGENHGFLLGFFLSFFGLIICALKQNRNIPQPPPYQNDPYRYTGSPTPPPYQQPDPTITVEEELRSLQSLYDQGLINEEEYIATRKKILGI